MRERLKELTYGSPYPFFVSEKDDGREYEMHGFRILTDGSIFTKIFQNESEGGVKQATKMYEIRVKDHSDEWRDWQAIVGDIIIMPFEVFQLEKDFDGTFKNWEQKFQDNFEIRYSGMLWRSLLGEVQIVEEESQLIKCVNRITLKVEYYSQLGNYCNPFEEQIKEQERFRKKYYAYDENGKRI